MFDLGQATEKDLDDEFCAIVTKELGNSVEFYANRYGYKYEVTNMEG